MRYKIGIDPGIITGIAVFDSHIKALVLVKSYKLFKVFDIIDMYNVTKDCIVYIENPNTWVPFKSSTRQANDSKLQGSGAVKQTYKHLLEFFADREIECIPTKIQGNIKKTDSKLFQQITGWSAETNKHGRDAALIVFNRN